MDLSFLKALVMILGISALVISLLGKLKIPSIVGFLLAGLIVSPHSLNVIKDIGQVERVAEIGVVLLMFTIGLEFSVKNLAKLSGVVFGGGFVQVSLTAGLIGFFSYLIFDHGLNGSLFHGFLVSLSSTAIVMKMLFDRSEVHSPYGRTCVGILIFQDLCVVPLLFLIPVLAGNEGGFGELLLALLKAVLLVAAILLLSRWGIPQVLHQVVSLKIRDLFIITIILLCLGTALVSELLGLSLALGAFLAGVIISESEYASQAMADILPFKESFTGLFFISVGMLMNLDFAIAHMPMVVISVSVILIVKIIGAGISTLALGRSLRTALQTGFYLSQIGEFSFVLAVAGKSQGLITEEFYQLFLASSVTTMMATPFMMKAGEVLSAFLASKPLFQKLDRGHGEGGRYPEQITDHVIIVGFGLNGKNLATVLKKTEIPYLVLDFDSGIVRKMKRAGEPIFFGDGTNLEILQKLGIQTAKVLVIAISDPAATRRITQLARKERPLLYIIVRTRYLAEVDDLNQLGADEVIPEEFETSIEIFSRVLHQYHVPVNVIAERTENVRKDSYNALRTVLLPRRALGERPEVLQDIEIEAYLLKEHFMASGRSISEVDLRARTGATIIAVQREGKIHPNPSSQFTLRSGDGIFLVGKKKEICQGAYYLESGVVANDALCPDGEKSEEGV
jgi:CPA2 family monovalent cation:H+ antiporter-2